MPPICSDPLDEADRKDKSNLTRYTNRLRELRPQAEAKIAAREKVLKDRIAEAERRLAERAELRAALKANDADAS